MKIYRNLHFVLQSFVVQGWINYLVPYMYDRKTPSTSLGNIIWNNNSSSYSYDPLILQKTIFLTECFGLFFAAGWECIPRIDLPWQHSYTQTHEQWNIVCTPLKTDCIDCVLIMNLLFHAFLWWTIELFRRNKNMSGMC